MSSKYKNIHFTVEHENVGSLSFLDIKICRKNSKFDSSVYRNPTFNGFFTNYESFIPTYQKREFFYTLLHRSFSTCGDFKKFHLEIDHLKTILRKSKDPPNFIDSCIRAFLDKLYTPITILQNVLKEIFLLSYRSWQVLFFKFERNFKKIFY